MKKGNKYIEFLDNDGWHKEIDNSKDENTITRISVNKKNYNRTKILLKVCLLFLLLVIIIVPFTYSRFFANGSVTNANVKVATFSFKVDDNTTNYEIDLANTILENDFSTTKVVPGTNGMFRFKIDFTGSKLATVYNITIDNANTVLPDNLLFYEDDQYSIPFTGFNGVVNLDNINTALFKTIYWKWVYTDDDESSWANQTIKLALTAEASQHTVG